MRFGLTERGREMDDTNVVDDAEARARFGSKEAEELVLRTVTAHAESLLRTARRHSLCLDDAQDAYQRGLEIFMRNADRLDPGRAAAWLHTVVKHEAMAVRQSRQQLVAGDDVDLDAHEARHLPTAEEQLLSFDLVARSAEALQRLKPQELRALWLKAQGHSYSDIAEATGWTYTKVNRCLTEGRRSFLERYAGIESGAECERWTPVLSAIVDGEATPAQLVELRPHLRNCPACRATLKALRDSGTPLAAVLPIPLLGAGGGAVDVGAGFLTRFYESVAGALHERAASSAMKLQAAFEASAAGKVAAVAASAAAVAGGGYATVERTTRDAEPPRPPARVAQPLPAPAPAVTTTPAGPAAPPVATSTPAAADQQDEPERRRTERERADEAPADAAFGFESGGGAPPPPSAEPATSAPAPAPPAPAPAPSGDHVAGDEFGF